MIVDQIKLYLKAGNGGEGFSSTRSNASRKLVGDGGNGGHGGNIVFKANPHLYDLNKFKYKRKFIAEDGRSGREHNKTGANGHELVVNVPLGTILKDLQGNVIFDFLKEEEFSTCRGGRGGEGNYKRAYTIPAQSGEEKEVLLDYRVINDIAIVGPANSGKTSLFNKLTNKNHKTAAYPFTTTACSWAQYKTTARDFIVLDTPPIKKSAPRLCADNSFLKHLYRSKIIIFLSGEPDFFEEEFSTIKDEIKQQDVALLKDKKIFYLLNKVDKIDKMPCSWAVLFVSVEKNIGIKQLKLLLSRYGVKE